MSRQLTFGSLFAGIGGFDLGFERAGMRCRWQVEIDKYANRVLEKHWPRVARWDDITTFPPAFGDWSVDVICGGFPCQDISYAGLGAGLDGERSGLFFEAIRVVQQLRPRIVVMENVAALLTRGLDRVLGTLAEIGFDAEWHCIPAASFGAPHIRDRVFVLAYSTSTRDTQWRQPFNGTDSARTCRTERIDEHGAVRRAWEMADANSTRLEKRQGKDARGAGSICGTKPGRSEWWSVEPDVGRVADGVSARVHRLRGFGNAVVPQVAEYIGRQIVEVVK